MSRTDGHDFTMETELRAIGHLGLGHRSGVIPPGAEARCQPAGPGHIDFRPAGRLRGNAGGRVSV